MNKKSACALKSVINIGLVIGDREIIFSVLKFRYLQLDI